MKLTAEEVYNKLVNDDKILEVKGQIRFYLGNVDIIVKQRDVVGNIMQEWLEGWLKKNGIEYKPNPNTQMPPDFFLDIDDTTKGLLEVKAFNNERTPAFDIADFNSFQSEIIEKPYMLHTKYLIFGYIMADDGFVTIKNLWLENLWSICRCMSDWPLNLQVKDNVVHKIRPAVWYSKGNLSFKPFESLEDFISAMEQTVYQNPKTRNISGTWLTNFIKSYKTYYGKKLIIPRWSEIEDKYRQS
mgnify:CR=1 FL=1